MNRVSVFHQRNYFLFFAITASLVLSTWMACRESVLNPDSICYLLSAQMVGKSGIAAAMHLCGQAKWPFYSMLIYAFVHLGHLSYATTAYLLDAFFSAISVVTFILIVKELGGSRRVLWLAAAVILLAHEFNSVREYIVRDHGFWACYLVSILFLLRYFQQPSLTRALVWSMSLVLATLFRIEGALFLLTMPFLSWFYGCYPLKQRMQSFLTLNLLTLIICVAITSWLVMHPQQTLDKFGRIVELKNQLLYGIEYIGIRYHTAQSALAQHVLTSDSTRDAWLVLPIVFMVWYVISVISNLSWIYGALVIYAWWNHILAKKNVSVLIGYLSVNIIVTFGFLAEHFFLSKRYLLALTLVLMLWIPFALDHLIQKSTTLRYRVCLCLTVLFIFISALGGIFDFGYSKSYIRFAGNWLAANVPQNVSLYANDYQLMYYSEHFGEDIFVKLPSYSKIDTIAQGKWKQYDYIALRLNKHESGETAAVLQEINLTPVQDFSNKRGDRVVIYKVR